MQIPNWGMELENILKLYEDSFRNENFLHRFTFSTTCDI